MPGPARLDPAAVEGLAPAQGGAGKGVCAHREGRHNEGVGVARLDPLAAIHGSRPDKIGPASAENCTGGQTRGGGVSPPYRCAQRRKRAEEGVGLTRLDPLVAHQGGRPGQTGPATAKVARGGRHGGGGGIPPYRCARRRKWGDEGVGLTRLDPLAARQGGRLDPTAPVTAENCTRGQTGGGGIPTVPVRPVQKTGRGRSGPHKTGPTYNTSRGQA